MKVLTKYQAEKEICSYHWEVVYTCNCCCPGPCHCVYKPAPPEAQVGDVLALTANEQVQLTSYASVDHSDDEAPVAKAANAAKPSVWQRLTNTWPFSKDSD